MTKTTMQIKIIIEKKLTVSYNHRDHIDLTTPMTIATA